MSFAVQTIQNLTHLHRHHGHIILDNKSKSKSCGNCASIPHCCRMRCTDGQLIVDVSVMLNRFAINLQLNYI